MKSGGHAAYTGASNIGGGITINLAKLNGVELSADRTVAKVGPGNTWYDAYTSLEPYNLTVIGGRVAAIGVGGLTLGGGVSFFSGKHGWACDNVYNYQVSCPIRLFHCEQGFTSLARGARGGCPMAPMGPPSRERVCGK